VCKSSCHSQNNKPILAPVVAKWAKLRAELRFSRALKRVGWILSAELESPDSVVLATSSIGPVLTGGTVPFVSCHELERMSQVASTATPLEKPSNCCSAPAVAGANHC
jgi:hypothetical protein